MKQRKRRAHVDDISQHEERARSNLRGDTSVQPVQIHHRLRIVLLLAIPPVPSIDLHLRVLLRLVVLLLHVLLQRRAPGEQLVRVGAKVAEEATAAGAVRTRPALALVPCEGVLGAVRRAAADTVRAFARTGTGLGRRRRWEAVRIAMVVRSSG